MKNCKVVIVGKSVNDYLNCDLKVIGDMNLCINCLVDSLCSIINDYDVDKYFILNKIDDNTNIFDCKGL